MKRSIVLCASISIIVFSFMYSQYINEDFMGRVDGLVVGVASTGDVERVLGKPFRIVRNITPPTTGFSSFREKHQSIVENS